MDCDRFGHCVPDHHNGPRVEVEIGVPLRPGVIVQPGMQEDPLRREAFSIANELRDPRMSNDAMNRIQNQVNHLDKRGVRAFEADLAEATGRNLLTEHRGYVQDQYRRNVPADFVDLTNPYTQQTRTIRAMPEEGRRVEAYPQQGYIQERPLNNTAVDATAGAVIGGILGSGGHGRNGVLKGALIGGAAGAIIGNIQDNNR